MGNLSGFGCAQRFGYNLISKANLPDWTIAFEPRKTDRNLRTRSLTGCGSRAPFVGCTIANNTHRNGEGHLRDSR
jgi:hypothetical protein